MEPSGSVCNVQFHHQYSLSKQRSKHKVSSIWAPFIDFIGAKPGTMLQGLWYIALFWNLEQTIQLGHTTRLQSCSKEEGKWGNLPRALTKPPPSASIALYTMGPCPESATLLMRIHGIYFQFNEKQNYCDRIWDDILTSPCSSDGTWPLPGHKEGNVWHSCLWKIAGANLKLNWLFKSLLCNLVKNRLT